MLIYNMCILLPRSEKLKLEKKNNKEKRKGESVKNKFFSPFLSHINKRCIERKRQS